MEKNIRTYKAVGDNKRFIREVRLIETYKGSAHWYVLIEPEGYGSNPEPLKFGVSEDWCDWSMLEVKEGYGIFRIEYATFIAKALTGAFTYEEDYELPKDWTHEQFISAREVCRKQGVPFRPEEWRRDSLGGYIGRWFEKSSIFIGIEKDGYAHS